MFPTAAQACTQRPRSLAADELFSFVYAVPENNLALRRSVVFQLAVQSRLAYTQQPRRL